MGLIVDECDRAPEAPCQKIECQFQITGGCDRSQISILELS
ncbi:hypothetical protein [Nostoc sp.]